ncbi:MAG: coproporphyrinogen III oxidase, partial [Lachnospiraceae bacterium]|nr:coproporphyrinogen III oxidase [Lachnospiraceae bacterium]
GKECRHNLGYWERVNYLGVGIGAASLIENERFQNTGNIEKYLEQPENSTENHEKLTISEQMEETMFLGLRKTQGISVSNFEAVFGVSFWQVYGAIAQRHIREGLLEKKTACDGQEYLALTKRGMDISNYVMADYLEPSLF